MSPPELKVKGNTGKVSDMSKGNRAKEHENASIWSMLARWSASASAVVRVPKGLSLLAIIMAMAMVLSTQAAFARPMLDDGLPVSGEAAGQSNYNAPISGQTIYTVAFYKMSPAEKQAVQDQVIGIVQANGGRVLHVFTIIDAVAVCVPSEAVGRLMAVPGVRYVEPDVQYQLSMDEVVDQINLTPLGDQTPSGWDAKYNGSGVTICTIDSGASGLHPDLRGKIPDFYDFVPGMTLRPGYAYDYNGHGTFIASQIVGSGVSSAGSDGVSPGIWKGTIPGYKLKEGDPGYYELRGPFKGIAPNATLIPLRVSIGTGASSLAIKQAIEYAIDNLHPDIISMSMNSGIEDNSMNEVVAAAVRNNIVFVVSAGNAGPNLGTVQCPANLPEVISVGAVNRNDSVAEFSSKGPTRTSVMKPDITAVGETVLGAKIPYNLDTDNGLGLNFTRYYQEYSGTSMATPEVTGVAALIIQCNKNMQLPPLTPAKIKAILVESARQPLGCPPEGNMAWGHGILDAYAAIKMVEENRIPQVEEPGASAWFEKPEYQVYESNVRLPVNVYIDRIGDFAGAVQIKCEALSGSGAVPGRDFSAQTQTLTFSPGVTLLPFYVDIIDNQIPTEDLAFTLKLTPMSNVAIPTDTCKITIRDTDQAEVYFTADSYTVKAGIDPVTIPVRVAADWTRNPEAGDIKVNVTTFNGSANSVDDYVASDQTLTFIKPIGGLIAYNKSLITIRPSMTPEGLKYFTVKLTKVENAVLGASSADTVWIRASTTDATSPPPNSLTCSPSPSPPASGWYQTDVVATISAADDGPDKSGIDYLTYSVNDGPVTKVDGIPPGSPDATAQAVVTISGEGENTLRYRATDNCGNAQDGAPVLVKIDKSGPVITYEQTPLANQFGWVNVVPVTVKFTATDRLSGVSDPTTSTKTCSTDGYHVASWSASDNAGNTASLAAVNIDTKPPVFINGGIIAPITPQPLGAGGTTITASCTFTDISGIGKPEWVNWTLDDGKPATVATCTVSGAPGSYTITATNTHTFTATGVYTITLSVTDAAGNYNQARFDYVVIYDPNGGFVTGGGWINSPAGAYVPNPALTGKATFGFESKYKKGATVPTGNTEFKFHVAGMNFKSTSYDWLVVAGSKAIYKGTGTINGAGSYGFILSAIDGTPDRFRIKIWDKNNGNAIVYDNQMGAVEDANPTMAIAGGSIVVHK